MPKDFEFFLNWSKIFTNLLPHSEFVWSRLWKRLPMQYFTVSVTNYTHIIKKKLGFPYIKARFTPATAVGGLQIFAVVQPKRARFTLPSNFVRLQAHKRKNPLNQITNSIDQWVSIFCGFWPPSINSQQHQWLPVERFWVASR